MKSLKLKVKISFFFFLVRNSLSSNVNYITQVSIGLINFYIMSEKHKIVRFIWNYCLSLK